MVALSEEVCAWQANAALMPMPASRRMRFMEVVG